VSETIPSANQIALLFGVPRFLSKSEYKSYLVGGSAVPPAAISAAGEERRTSRRFGMSDEVRQLPAVADLRGTGTSSFSNC